MSALNPGDGAGSTWARRARAQVVRDARAFVARHASSARQRRLLETAFLEMEARHHVWSRQPFMHIHLPLLIHGGIRGSTEPAFPLAVAISLLELGIELHDHIADRELGSHWNGYSPELVLLAASGFLSALPQLALAELERPPGERLVLERTLARGLFRVGSGQQLDLELMNCDSPTVEDVEAAVDGKTGERWALSAELAARFAGAPEETVLAYADFARARGAARQFASDLGDVFGAPESRDLAAGARTLPIALHVEKLDGAARGEFLDLLRRAREDQTAREEVRGLLLKGGVLHRCAFTIELYRHRALRSLEEAAPLEPAGAQLRAMADSVSVGGVR